MALGQVLPKQRSKPFSWFEHIPLCMTTDDKETTGGDDNDDKQVILRGTQEDTFSEEFWDEIEAGQPSELSVMKDVCVERDVACTIVSYFCPHTVFSNQRLPYQYLSLALGY